MGRVCKRPTAIGARVVSSNTSYQLAGDTVHLTPSSGLLCFSQQQNDGQCEDYQVRYCCPGEKKDLISSFCYPLVTRKRRRRYTLDESILALKLPGIGVFRLNFASDFFNLQLVRFHRAGIVIVKHLIQGRNNEAWVIVEPSTLQSWRSY